MRTYPRPHSEDQATLRHPPYAATARRAPLQPLIVLPHTLSELTGPVYGHNPIGDADNDLTRQHAGEPIGERIIVAGRVVDAPSPTIAGTIASSRSSQAHIRGAIIPTLGARRTFTFRCSGPASSRGW